MPLTWPVNEDALILWSQVLLSWVLCQYVIFGNDPVIDELGEAANQKRFRQTRRSVALRAVALVGAVLTITWAGWPTLVLAFLLAAAAAALPLLRIVLAVRRSRLGAELEFGGNALVVIVSGLIIGNPSPAPLRGILTIPLSGRHLIFAILLVTILAFLSTAGTHIVRGLLAKVDTLPTTSDANTSTARVDVPEYNRGRVIGVVERLIMTALVAVSAYGALTFLIGAKGLIRSKEFENHQFAEYFLIGTLCSAALAVAFGLLLQGLSRLFW